MRRPGWIVVLAAALATVLGSLLPNATVTAAMRAGTHAAVPDCPLGNEPYSVDTPLLDILLKLQAKAPVKFELVAVHLDQKQPGYDPDVLPNYLRGLGVPFEILEQDTYSVVKRVIPEGKTMCSLCSRLRRGSLYTYAAENGFTKIALGHHRDDIVETLFLNLFHQAALKAMPPKLRSDDGRNVLIRPLAYCAEDDIAEYAQQQGFPIMPCNLCGSQENLQRKTIKAMLGEWEKKFPGRTETIFRAIGNVAPSQLADRNLFDFAGLGADARTPRADAHAWLAGEAREGEGAS